MLDWILLIKFDLLLRLKLLLRLNMLLWLDLWFMSFRHYFARRIGCRRWRICSDIDFQVFKFRLNVDSKSGFPLGSRFNLRSSFDFGSRVDSRNSVNQRCNDMGRSRLNSSHRLNFWRYVNVLSRDNLRSIFDLGCSINLRSIANFRKDVLDDWLAFFALQSCWLSNRTIHSLF